jgi:broad specificity phosphatase PhoE
MPRGTLLLGDRGPSELVLVRHGESIGNVADRKARESGAKRLDLDVRDADVPLSEAGREQAGAVGRLMADLGPDRRPGLVVSSPYRRAEETAERALRECDGDVTVVVDERVRERDLGRFDGLTSAGIKAQFADEAERRTRVGKFYYVPPSGESWCDVALRVRSLLADLRAGYDGRRVWVFTHEAVIMSFRYVVESLTEKELLDIGKSTGIPNCSVTSYRAEGGGLQLITFADTGHVDQSAAPTTTEPSKTERAAGAG